MKVQLTDPHHLISIPHKIAVLLGRSPWLRTVLFLPFFLLLNEHFSAHWPTVLNFFHDLEREMFSWLYHNIEVLVT